MYSRSRVSYAVSALLALSAPLLAHAARSSSSSPASAQTPPEAQPHSRSFVTTHTGMFGGTTITYTAAAADTLLTDANGAPTAAIFSFTYTRQGVNDIAKRPVLFIFNGGPGSASLWIHMGALGPRRIVTDDPAHPQTVGPFHTSDNPLSPLDIADLKGRTFDGFVNEVRQFAATEYGAALFAGSRLPEDQRQAIAVKLAAASGLSESFILEHDLRISSSDFAEQRPGVSDSNAA